jgi:hypothetical protein
MLIETRGHCSDDLLGEGYTTTAWRADRAIDHRVGDRLQRCLNAGPTIAESARHHSLQSKLDLLKRHGLGRHESAP